MLTFRQYLNEIFRPSENTESHAELKRNTDLVRHYVHDPRDESGRIIRGSRIVTSFERNNPTSNRWYVHFTVGATHDREDSGTAFPSTVTKQVFDHLSHFVARHRNETKGTSPVLVYDTEHPKKDRIYQAVSKRLGVQAVNNRFEDTREDQEEPRRRDPRVVFHR